MAYAVHVESNEPLPNGTPSKSKVAVPGHSGLRWYATSKLVPSSPWVGATLIVPTYGIGVGFGVGTGGGVGLVTVKGAVAVAMQPSPSSQARTEKGLPPASASEG